jgi:hypothetical protein
MEFVLKTDSDQLVGSSMKKHKFDISNILLKVSGIFLMMETLCSKLPKVFSYIDLTHFLPVM